MSNSVQQSLKKFIQSQDSIKEILEVFEELKKACELEENETGSKIIFHFEVYNSVRDATCFDSQFKDLWKLLDKKFLNPPKNPENKNLGNPSKLIQKISSLLELVLFLY
jgi:hypothetical protein